MKIHRPDQDKEKEKKAKAANRQALMAQKPLHIDPLAFDPPLPNGPLKWSQDKTRILALTA